MVGVPGFCLLYGGLASPFLDSGPVSRVRGILSIAGKARWVAGTYVHSDDQVGWGNDDVGVLVRLHRPAVRFQLDSI